MQRAQRFRTLAGVELTGSLIAWAVARDTAVIPKSTDPDHIRSNLESADIELTEIELERIAPLDRHYRFIPSDAFRTESGLYANIFDD